MKVRNVHTRSIPATIDCAAPLLDGLAGADDRLWPHDRWPAMRLDRPLAVGAKGGHGPVRYSVAEYLPGRKVLFRFDPATGLMRGFAGSHWFELNVEPDGIVIRHVIEAHGGPGAVLRWLLLVRPMHDALIEDALDRAELVLLGRVRSPARWNWRVRLLRRLARRRRERSEKAANRTPPGNG